MAGSEWSNITFFFYVFIIFFCTVLTKVLGDRSFTIRVAGVKKRIPVGMSVVAFLLIIIKGFSLTGTDIRIGSGYWLDFVSADSFQGFRDYAIEPLYILLNVVIKNTFNSYSVFLLTVAIITVIPPIYLIWKYRYIVDISLAVFSYLCLFYFNSFSAIRQYMAVSISLFAFDAFYEQKKKKSLICIAMASLMHKTLLVLMIPYIYMNIKEFKKRHLFFGMAILLVLTIVMRDNIYARFATSERYYVYKAAESIDFGFEQLVYYIPLFILYYYGKKKRQAFIFDRLSLCYLCMGFLLGLTGYVITIFGRMNAIMLPLIFIIPYYLNISRMWIKRSRLLFDMLLYMYCFARFYIWISQYYVGEALMPYITIFGSTI